MFYRFNERPSSTVLYGNFYVCNETSAITPMKRLNWNCGWHDDNIVVVIVVNDDDDDYISALHSPFIRIAQCLL